MANLFLTRKCNLKCPYCFADEFVNKENEEYTMENFHKAINFIKTMPGERLGFIGGEPTLHPKFKEMLDYVLKDDEIGHFIIYTNGLELHKYIDDLKFRKVNMLINCNPPADLGEKRFNRLKENITLLKEKGIRNFNLGINLYSKDMDYSYIFDLLKISGNHQLRFSTALPNSDKEEMDDPLKSFMDFKPFLFQFFEDCIKNEIVPNNDCNAIPQCLLTPEDKKTQLKLAMLSKEYRVPDTITTAHTCNPVIDILPDLTAVRCFGLSKYMKASIEEHKNMENLRNYFINQIDLYARLSFVSEGCNACKMRMLNRCGLCFTYKMKQCEKIKDYILENSYSYRVLDAV